MRLRELITLLLIIPVLIKGQSVIGEWDSYTSVLNVRDILAIDNSILAASSGGLVEYDKTNGQFETYTIKNGLSRNDIQCMALDNYHRIWLGMSSPDGEINIWNNQAKTVEEVFNSFDFGDELTSIVSIVFTGNKAFAAYRHNVDWGIAYFKIIDGEYRYQDRLEAFPFGVSGINSLQVLNDTLWLAASTGLLSADLNQTDLKPESAWQIVDLPEPGNVSKVISYAGKSLFNLDNKIYEIRDGKSYSFNENQAKSIKDLFLDNSGELRVLTSSGVDRYTSGAWTRIVTVAATTCIFDNEDILWGGSENHCLWSEQAGKPHYLIPNTILDNIYTALWVNEDGTLMAGTQKGFSYLTDAGWYNIRGSYNTISIHDDVDRDWVSFVADTIAYSLTSLGRIYNLVRNKNGNYFAPQYASHLDFVTDKGVIVDYLRTGGLMEFNLNDLSNYTLYDTTDQKLAASEGKGGSDYYLGIGYVALDSDENLWIANQYAQNDNVIAVLTGDDRWLHFNIEESNGYLNYHTTSIIFDKAGRVWFASEVHTGETPSPANGGIAVLDYNGTLFDKDDDEWFWITTSNGLANNAVYSLAFDQNDDLWIMNADGIQRATIASNFPSRYFSQIDNAVLASVPFAKECRIKVDGLNNKWITTVGYGVKVYTHNGVWLNDVEGFTTGNSGLLSNTVLDVAFNNNEGLVYLATNKGISVYKSAYAVYGKKYRELKIFPMPYEIPSTRPLVIDGLLQESDVKIITLDGTFIRHLSYIEGDVVGQQAFWDGKDHHGRYVSSGVYLCMVYTKEGDTTVGKIAVIRK